MAPNCTPHPGTYRPSWWPQLQVNRCHVGRDSHLQSLWCSWRGNFWCQCNFSHHRSRGFRYSFFRLLRGSLEMVADGVWWHFLGGVGTGHGGNEIWLLSGAHIDPLPLIWPLPIQSSMTPPSPITRPPLSMHLFFLTSPDPERKKWGLSPRSDSDIELKKKTKKRKYRYRVCNNEQRGIPHVIISVPPPLPALGHPHLHAGMNHS